jgi:hypothetical protein
MPIPITPPNIEHHRLDKKVGSTSDASADGETNADFACSLRDVDEHDVHDADASDE